MPGAVNTRAMKAMSARNIPAITKVNSAARDVLGLGVVSGFPAGCDARHLQNRAGVPTIVFGSGDLQHAHSIDVTAHRRAV